MSLKNTSLSATSKAHGDPITSSLYSDLCKLLENDSFLSIEVDDLKSAQQEIISCINSCAANCSSSCGKTCGGQCTGGCGNNCGGACATQCVYGCNTSCKGGCYGACESCSGP